MFDVAKCADPTTRLRFRGVKGRGAANGESARAVSGGVGRVRKGLLPQFEVGLRGMEFDISEEVFSRPRNPRLGDDTTDFECGWFVVEVVDDEVEYLMWESARHRGFGPTR